MYQAEDRSPGPRDFDAFFLEHYMPLVRALTFTIGDGQIAAESVQDAFCRAYARWWRVSRLDRPEAWIRRVALNRSRDRIRSDRRRRDTELRAFVARGTPAGEELTVDGDATGIEVSELLGELSERQREVVALHYLEDRSIDDIASTLDIASGTVKIHLARGRQRLRDLIARHTTAGTR